MQSFTSLQLLDQKPIFSLPGVATQNVANFDPYMLQKIPKIISLLSGKLGKIPHFFFIYEPFPKGKTNFNDFKHVLMYNLNKKLYDCPVPVLLVDMETT